jgi:hypothetical protein
VFSVSLNIWPTAEAAEARFRAELAGRAGAVELGVGHATLTQLAASADEPAGVRLGALAERLLVDDVGERAAGSLEKIARSRGLRRSLAQIFAALRRVGVSAGDFERAARAVGGHAREVARAFAEYERRLGARFDEAEVWRRGCARIAAGAPVRMLDGVTEVEVRGVFDWDGARLALLDGIFARGLAVRVHLPAAESPALQRALAPSLSALESRHESALEVVREPLRAPARRPRFVAAATPFVEAREVARQVRDRVDAGVAPESIAVIAQSEARRELLYEAMTRYRVPVAERRRASAASAPPVQIALALLSLPDERLSRDRLIALASSRYLAAGALPAHRLARVLREAGVVDLDDWRTPLEAWVAARREARAADGERVSARLDELLRILRALPAQATVGEHCVALRAALERLDVPARTRGFSGVDDGGPVEGRALARDQSALRTLELLLDDLPRAAARLDLRRAPMPRARFARLLEESLAAESVRAGGVRGAAVELGDLASLAGRAPTHLFVCGLVDGELPARPPEDPLLDDDERVRLNRLLGRAALPLSGGAEARSSLAFFTLLSDCADSDISISWSRADEEGAPQLRSALVDELGARDKELVALPRDPLPRVAEARTLDELTARVALEVRGDRASRLSLPDREASTELYRLLAVGAPERLARIDHLATVERLRERFFAGKLPAHPSVGALRDSALLERLVQALPGREQAPLSASAVESYAACHFQFFLRLLGASPVEEVEDELDPLAAGRLHHRVLERIFRRLADEGRLPLDGSDAERAAVRAAWDDALVEWRQANPIGHPALFAVAERRLWRQVEALLDAERKNPPSEKCLPARFETRFGPLPVRAPDSDERIFLHGVIDRVDIGDGRAVVLDYKSGAKARYASQIKSEALCDSAWQLPIYLAAARAALGPTVALSARFYSLRDVSCTAPVEGGDWVALDDLARRRAPKPGASSAPRPLGDALWELHRAMRGGDFSVAPREDACDRCRMEAACRVIRAVDPEEVPE